MNHLQFTYNIATLQRLLRALERAHKDSYYNVEDEAGQSIKLAVESLTAALEAQAYSEHYDPDANYS